jgi:hypothetical protein
LKSGRRHERRELLDELERFEQHVVHWPTDVLAGVVCGRRWAMLCWLVALWLQRRGQVESENDSGGDRGAKS